MSPAARTFLLALTCLPAAAGAQTPAPAAAPPLVEAGFVGRAPVPAAVHLEQAAQAEAIMAETLEQTRARLDAAREARDIVQVNCVTARLAAIKGLLELVEVGRQSLEDATASGDRVLIETHARQIGIARARAEAFRVQVEGCVGEVSQYTGDTRIDLEVDPALRKDDPSRAEPPPVFTPISLARPPALSGSQ